MDGPSRSLNRYSKYAAVDWGHVAQGADFMGELSQAKLQMLQTLVIMSPDRV